MLVAAARRVSCMEATEGVNAGVQERHAEGVDQTGGHRHIGKGCTGHLWGG